MHFHIFIAFIYIKPSLPKRKYRYDATIIISSRQYHRFFFLTNIIWSGYYFTDNLMFLQCQKLQNRSL